MELVIGRIYKSKTSGELYRIFKAGGGKWYSGRGCTKQTAVPYNFLHSGDFLDATLDEVNSFLEQEMVNGMAQKTNK